MRAVPMDAHDAVDQHLVLRTGATHAVLQGHGVFHGAIGGAADHAHERIFHVAGEVLFEDVFELDAVLVMVGVRDGSDVAVGAVGEDGANGDLFGADFAFGGAVQLGDVRVDRLWDDRGGILLPSSSDDHGIHPLSLCRQVGSHVGFERAVVCLLVRLFYGVHVCIGTTDQYVV